MVFSSIDQHGRYAYGNQPKIAQWNLARLAETLLDLINPDDSDDAVKRASDVVNGFPEVYERAWISGMRAKLGLAREEPEDTELAVGLLAVLETQAPISPVFSAVFRSRFRARRLHPVRSSTIRPVLMSGCRCGRRGWRAKTGRMMRKWRP
jgi:uncharacterized protein YdiU (UPF0061 family)